MRFHRQSNHTPSITTKPHTVYKVSKKHLYFPRPLTSHLQLRQRDVRILCKFFPPILGQDVRPLLPATLVCLHAPIYRGFVHEPANWLPMRPAGEAIAQTLTSTRTVPKQLAKEVSYNGRVHDLSPSLFAAVVLNISRQPHRERSNVFS